MIALIASFFLVSVQDQELLSQNQVFWIKQLDNQSPDLRMNALAILGELKNPETVSRIGTSLEDRDPRVRFYAIQALSKIIHEESARTLAARVDKESDPYLRSELKRASKSVDDLLKAQAEKAQGAQTKGKP